MLVINCGASAELAMLSDSTLIAPLPPVAEAVAVAAPALV